jgi:hypothetical protein
MPTMHIAQQRGRDPDNYKALCGAKTSENLTYDRSGTTCWRCAHLVLGRPLPTEPPCPEHDRLKVAKTEVRDATQLVGEFLEWLTDSDEAGYVIADRRGDELVPCGVRNTELIANFFGINENALESEKMALLEYQRALNAATEWAEKEGFPYLRANP